MCILIKDKPGLLAFRIQKMLLIHSKLGIGGWKPQSHRLVQERTLAQGYRKEGDWESPESRTTHLLVLQEPNVLEGRPGDHDFRDTKPLVPTPFLRCLDLSQQSRQSPQRRWGIFKGGMSQAKWSGRRKLWLTTNQNTPKLWLTSNQVLLYLYTFHRTKTGEWLCKKYRLCVWFFYYMSRVISSVTIRNDK